MLKCTTKGNKIKHILINHTYLFKSSPQRPTEEHIPFETPKIGHKLD